MKCQQPSGQLHSSTAGTSAIFQTYTVQGVRLHQTFCILSLPPFSTIFLLSAWPRWISTHCKHTGVTSDQRLFVQLLFTTFPFLACRSPFLILIFAWITKWHLQFTSSGKSKYPPVLTAINTVGCCSALEWLQLLFKGTEGLLGLQHPSSSL